MSKKITVPFLLVMVFMVPMVVAWTCYHYYGFFQFKTINHGTFIQPPVALAGHFPQKWQLVLITGAQCDTHCQKTFFSLQQMVKLLGKDQGRVIVKKVVPAQDEIFKQYSWIPGRVYLIDPLGNLFMYYPATVAPLAVLHDLQRLLEVSQIG